MLQVLRELDEKAIAEANTGGLINIHSWNAEEREKFRKIAQGEWLRFAGKSPMAKKVYDTLVAWFEKQ